MCVLGFTKLISTNIYNCHFLSFIKPTQNIVNYIFTFIKQRLSRSFAYMSQLSL